MDSGGNGYGCWRHVGHKVTYGKGKDAMRFFFMASATSLIFHAFLLLMFRYGKQTV